MPTRERGRKMYESTDRSLRQRITLALLLGACLAISCWLLLGDGISLAGAFFHLALGHGDRLRRTCLAGALSIYFARVLLTEFVFLKRGVSWSEVFMIAPWVAFIEVFLSIAGGTNSAPFGGTDATALVLFAVGSWMSSYAEYSRHVWKQRPENHKKLYTRGLFRFTRHPNYLGDLLSFSGLCLLTGRWPTAAIPALMAIGFLFVNIPALDAHLQDRYGAAFDEYATRSWKLIPLIY